MHTTGLTWMVQFPELSQVSVPLQTLPSEQTVPGTGVCVHVPVEVLQVSVVHTLLSLQLGGLQLMAPPVAGAPPVDELPPVPPVPAEKLSLSMNVWSAMSAKLNERVIFKSL